MKERRPARGKRGLTGGRVLPAVFNIRIFAALMIAAVGFGVMAAPTPALAKCSFVSFWHGGCDKQIVKALKIVRRATSPIPVSHSRPPSCGADGQRPCNVWEHLPSCGSGLKEDFGNHTCVKLGPGEWSPFFAGLKSAAEQVARIGTLGRRDCMNSAADFVQQHGHSPVALSTASPGGLSGHVSPDLEAYIAIGFSCSTPLMLGTVGAIGSAVGSSINGIGTGHLNIGEVFTHEYNKYYNGAVCTSIDNEAGRISCAVADVVSAGAADGVACVAGAAQAGIFDGFVPGGHFSDRDVGLFIGQALYIVGQQYAISYMFGRITDKLGEYGERLKGKIDDAVDKATFAAFDAGNFELAEFLSSIGAESESPVAKALLKAMALVGKAAKGARELHKYGSIVNKIGHIRACNRPITSTGRPYKSIVTTHDDLFAVAGDGKFYYYGVVPGGKVGASGQIGTGWDRMKTVVAGDSGTLFAIDKSATGTLYYNELDSRMRWKLTASKVRDSACRSVSAAEVTTVVNDEERWVLSRSSNIVLPSEPRLPAVPRPAPRFGPPHGFGGPVIGGPPPEQHRNQQIGHGPIPESKAVAEFRSRMRRCAAQDASSHPPPSIHWAAFKQVLPGGSYVLDGYRQRVLYAITDKGDLLRYRFGKVLNFFTYTETKIGSGWGGMKKVFSADGGNIYAVDAKGDLYRYRYNFDVGSPGGGASRKKLGNGWLGYKKLFAGSDGSIYALAQDDRLWYYRDTFGHGLKGREYIGFGFNFPMLTAMKN